MGKRSDYVAARKASQAQEAPRPAGVPRLVPLFPVRAQDAERVCGHTGELPAYTRFWCPCCNKTGAIYERRLSAALAREIRQQQAAEARRERQRKAARAESRRKRLARNAPELIKAG